MTTHQCPRPGCGKVVSDSVLCCPGDWWALNDGARQAISKTAKLSLLAAPRRAAIDEARRQWGRGRK